MERTIVVEIAESDFLAVMQQDTEAGRPPNIFYVVHPDRRANRNPGGPPQPPTNCGGGGPSQPAPKAKSAV